MDERIKNVMAAVFGISVDEIDESSSTDTIKQWNSINSLNLVSALEDEFDVQFTDTEMLEMTNYRTVSSTVRKTLER